MLCCILTLLSGCKDDDDNPLRFYNSEYEVPMGGRRYLGLESGNGDYSLAVKDTRIASAGTETGWSGVPAGRMIYVTGILTGTTYLTVTDNATQETCTLPIKVVDNYENMELLRSYLSNLPNGDANLLPGISDIFLINNHARDAYFFKQGEQTAFSSGLELITQGSYKLEKEEGDDKKMTLTLTFSEDMATPVAGTTMVYVVMMGLGLNSDLCMIGYSLILAMNYLPGMAVITLNVIGDAATNVIVCAKEHCLNKEIYNSKTPKNN